MQIETWCSNKQATTHVDILQEAYDKKSPLLVVGVQLKSEC
jgi:hypothetical protein